MVDELSDIPDPDREKLKWNEKSKNEYLENYRTNRKDAVEKQIHDTMAFGGGSSVMKAFMWKLMGEFCFRDRVRLMSPV